jgi:hypothetical protein
MQQKEPWKELDTNCTWPLGEREYGCLGVEKGQSGL